MTIMSALANYSHISDTEELYNGCFNTVVSASYIVSRTKRLMYCFVSSIMLSMAI